MAVRKSQKSRKVATIAPVAEVAIEIAPVAVVRKSRIVESPVASRAVMFIDARMHLTRTQRALILKRLRAIDLAVVEEGSPTAADIAVLETIAHRSARGGRVYTGMNFHNAILARVPLASRAKLESVLQWLVEQKFGGVTDYVKVYEQ